MFQGRKVNPSAYCLLDMFMVSISISTCLCISCKVKSIHFNWKGGLTDVLYLSESYDHVKFNT
jgi:hypothetical protein